MKTPFRELGLVFLLSSQFCPAQTSEPADDWKPATSNQPGKQYPQVNSEGRVRFRIVAPQARNVTVSFRDSSTFTQDADGAWIGTTRPLDEGFHYYTINLDGAEVPDPNSLFFFGANRWGSGVELPAHDQDFYALKNVPHGTLREILFYSKSTDSVRRAFVYTPPGYDQDWDQRFPALYLQHGWGENEYGWGVQGRAGLIMDNLIAEGKTRPFIISHIGLFSGGSIGIGDITDMAAFKEMNKLVFISYGGREVGGDRGGAGRRGGDPQANVEALPAAGINRHYYLSPDTAHEWQSWRRSLHQFAPLLFAQGIFK